MLFTIWYVFGVAGTGCSFLCLVLLSEALVRQDGISGDGISEQLLVIKDFISPLLMKLSLAGYEILG